MRQETNAAREGGANHIDRPLFASFASLSAEHAEIAAWAADQADRVQKGQRQRIVYLDMSDLFEYVRHNNSVSGIQRVVANLIEHAPEAARLHEAAVTLVIPEYEHGRVFSVDPARVREMLAALDVSSFSRVTLDRAIVAVHNSRKIAIPDQGDIFTIAGAFWTYDNYDMLMRMRDRGVVIINFIHDLIQISYPEYVHEAATLQYRRALVDILSSSTGLLTNSEYVAQDVRKFISARTDVEMPVRAVPLATELAPRVGQGSPVSADVAQVLGTSYILSVATIEVRKNHYFMVQVWEKLIEERVENLPDLVFVGKIGWNIDPLIQYLAGTNNLNGKVKILSRVSDSELSELYQGALFTMYMSFAEGFGLPVAESLAYGVPCISSNRTSMPEVGGRFARYLDPEDVAGGIALVRELIGNSAALAEWRSDIAKNFRVRTWRQFAVDYVAALMTFIEPSASRYNECFRAGELHGMGHWEILRRDANQEKLSYLCSTRSSGWNANEHWGCWSASRAAELTVPTDLEAGTEVTIYLQVKAPGHHQTIGMRIDAGGATANFSVISSSPVWKTCEGRVIDNGVIFLRLMAEGAKPEVSDDRDLYIGLMGMAFRPRDDVAMGLKILEVITLDPDRLGPPLPALRPDVGRLAVAPVDQVDPEWYLDQYPDVRLLGLSADEHYQWIGKRLGRLPNPRALLENNC